MARCPVCSGDHPRTECPDAAQPLAPGHRLDDKYTVVRHISTGGMGAVYEVEHVALGKRLAAKLLLPELARRPELLERFRREARAASATGHENIVEVTDLGTTSSRIPFLIMELLNGRTLGSELKNGRLEPERAVHITRQILAALSAAHEQKIIHRDLKPENVFLIQRAGDPDFVKVLDFGIAKMLDEVPERELTQAGQVVGTPTYMAPEQARGDPNIDARADVYATGAMLYRMVTGHRPFQGANFNALLFAIAQGNPTRPSQHAKEVSMELDAVILRAMAIDPRKRFQSAKEFDEALALEDRTGERTTPRVVPPTADEANALSTPGWENRSVTMVGHGSSTRGRVGRVISRTTLWALALATLVVAGAVARYLWQKHVDAQRQAEVNRLRADAEAANERAKMIRGTLAALTLDVQPPSARVSIDGAQVSGFEISIARDGQRHVVHAEADGYVTEDRPFFANGDQRLEVHLKKKHAGKPKNVGPTNADGVDEQQMKTLQKLLNKLGEETSSF
ncbi:MAG TPA: serine/threonine-protein kinase [Polyangia bacterium]|nr:serine/threonine-protein kinase [Polyangia bacterium]